MADYDIAVIGAGQGGLPAAHLAARLGAKVLLIERRQSRPLNIIRGFYDSSTIGKFIDTDSVLAQPHAIQQRAGANGQTHLPAYCQRAAIRSQRVGRENWANNSRN
ncbi:MAG: FAD-dependent oxidoreductase [Chloroflexi bacterium]|nr:MAG: FAD-dependent oxidoreductase [Chloroflexota bacterium]